MDNSQAKTILRPSDEKQKEQSVVAIITARGGSKGLPRKNIRLVDGKPLIAHSILAALKCPSISRCIVSTEDEEIKAVSLEWGAEVIDRPANLATDTALSRDVVRQILVELEERRELPEYFVLLQPTSPLRTEVHLSECIEQFLSSGKASAVSVTETEHHPFKSFIVGAAGVPEPLRDYESLESPRQLLPKAYRQNGAIYLLSCRAFLAHNSFFVPPLFLYPMNHETSVDIDDAFDLALVEMLIAKMKSDAN